MKDIFNSGEKNDWKKFELMVFNVLSLSGMQVVTHEKQFASKKVDIYFENLSFGSKRRYAVECKNYKKVLHQGDIAEIYSSHFALFNANEITDLLIVSNARLGPSAQSYVDSIANLSHMSFNDLRNSLIDFRGYLAGVKLKFNKEDVWNYYIEPHGSIKNMNTGEIIQTPNEKYCNLVDLILSEIKYSTDPLVVLGAYGIGKTTLAKKIFLIMLNDWEEDSGSPIPIYISLDRMMREQSLEGLLGSLFTTSAPCSGYNFDLFCILNEMGYFTLIFDGLDEMRHKLTWEEFQYNLNQLAILTSKNSRSILLGRPTAFMNKMEYDIAIQGKKIEKTYFEINNNVSYREVIIDQFDNGQISRFVDIFCQLRNYGNKKLQYKASKILKIIMSDGNEKIYDLAKRPIQLWMLLEIFPNLPINLDKLTQAIIYSEFIDELIHREIKKTARRLFSADEHRLFGQKIAWWLWLRGGENRLEASQIGREVFSDFIEKYPNEDVMVIRRSLITSSFLSTQGGTFLHFPHRSIHEFFVAEYLAILLSLNEGVFCEFQNNSKFQVNEVFSTEVIDFLMAQISYDQIRELSDFFNKINLIPRNSSELMKSYNAKGLIYDNCKRTGSIVSTWLCMQEIIRTGNENGDPILNSKDFALLLCGFVRNRIEQSKFDNETSEEVATYLLCILLLASADISLNYLVIEIFFSLVKIRVDLFLSQKNNSEKFHKIKQITIKEQFLDEFAKKLLKNLFSYRLSIEWMYKYLRSKSKNTPIIPEWVYGDGITIPKIHLQKEIFLTKKDLGRLNGFQSNEDLDDLS